jgi:predicted dehydrogenase
VCLDIKVTVVGCGAATQNLYKNPLRKLEKRGEFHVVGLVDKDSGRCQMMRKVFQKASIYESLRAAVNETGSNLVIIASPPALHAEHCITALANGSHVLCEKPMALSSKQCANMIAASQKAGRLLAVGMSRRFFPAYQFVKQQIDSGVFGEIVSFSYQEGGRYNWPVTTAAAFQRSKGGGILFDIGSHVIDLMLWFFGELEIVAYADDAMAGGIETSCRIETGNGTRKGSIHLSWDHHLTHKLSVKGTRAETCFFFDHVYKLRVENLQTHETRAFNLQAAIDPAGPRHPAGKKLPLTPADCIYQHLIKVVRAMKFQEKLPVDPEETKSGVALMERCYQIATPIDMAWLPPAQLSAYKIQHWKRNQWKR